MVGELMLKMEREGFEFSRNDDRDRVVVSYRHGSVPLRRETSGRDLESTKGLRDLQQIRREMFVYINAAIMNANTAPPTTAPPTPAASRKRKAELEMMMRADSWHDKPELHKEYMAVVTKLETLDRNNQAEGRAAREVVGGWTKCSYDHKKILISPRRHGKTTALEQIQKDLMAQLAAEGKTAALGLTSEQVSGFECLTGHRSRRPESHLGPGRVPPAPGDWIGPLLRSYQEEAPAEKRKFLEGRWREPSVLLDLEQRTEEWLRPAREKIKAIIPNWRTA